jgi:hypothetical protein
MGGTTLSIKNSTIAGNSATGGGAGIYVDTRQSSTIENCLIAGNCATGGAEGGGIETFGSLSLVRCILVGNSADRGGGIVYRADTSWTINNSIIAKNLAGYFNDIYDVYDPGTTRLSARNTLLGDGAGQSQIINGSNGNIVGTAISPVDPMFISFTSYSTWDWDKDLWQSWDLRLTADSPAIDKGCTYSAPTMPGNFRSTYKTHTSVTLMWYLQSNLTNYTLQYKKTTDTDWTTWTPTPGANAIGATITGLVANTTYIFN